MVVTPGFGPGNEGSSPSPATDFLEIFLGFLFNKIYSVQRCGVTISSIIPSILLLTNQHFLSLLST